MATWPMSQDYNEAIQNPAHCFTDRELQQGEAVTNALGLPVPCSGNFADVYAMTVGPRKWAVKCFTRQIPGLKERYAEVSKYLQQVQLPFMVDFRFLEQGIRVRGQWFPILKMQWVEGLALNTFVRENLDKPQILDKLCQIWLKLASRLREANLAHCDLQHGNVLMVQGDSAGKMGVKLVDYDGMCVPALELLKSIELGHPAYQHPQRLREGTYGLQIDRFPNLVIYTAIRAIMAGGKGLWKKYDNGDNLLFRQTDFEAPRTSALFQELLKLNDPEVKKLAQAVAIASQNPIDRVPLLEQLVEMPKPKPASTAVTAAPVRRTGMGNVTSPATSSAGSAFAGVDSSRPIRRHTRPKRGLALAGIGAVGLIAAVTALYFGLRPSPRSQEVELAQGAPKSEHRSPKRTTIQSSSPRATIQQPKTNPGTGTEPRPEPKPQPELKPQPEPEPKSQPVVTDPIPKTGEPVASLRGSSGPVGFLTFSPDSRTLAAGHGGFIKLWDVARRRNITSMGLAVSGMMASGFVLAFSPDGKTVGQQMGNDIKLWDVASGSCIATLQGGGQVRYFAFSPDGKSLAMAIMLGQNNEVGLWDIASRKKITTFKTELGPVVPCALAFGPGGKSLALAGRGLAVPGQGLAVGIPRSVGWIKLWEVSSGNATATHKLNLNDWNTLAMAFSPNGKALVTASPDKLGNQASVVNVWDVDKGTHITTVPGERPDVSALALSPDAKTLASGSFRDGKTKLWNLATSKNVATLDGPVVFSPDGKILASGSGDGTIKLWAVQAIMDASK